MIGRKPAILAFVVATAFGLVITVAVVEHGYSSLLRSDAQHFYRVATDPFGTGTAFDGAPPGAGTAYRYGRILYPLIAWVLAVGRADLVPFTLPLVYLGGVWLLAAMACELCAHAGKPPERGLVVFALPAVLLMAPFLVPELLITGLALLVYRLVLAKRTRDAWIVAALMLLARETMILAIVPMLLRSIVRRRYAEVLGWATTAIPLLLWWTWVRYRIGYWPFLDPGVTYLRPLDLPFRGFLAALWSTNSEVVLIVAAAAGCVTIAFALWASLVGPWFPVTGGALASALLVVFFGPAQASLPGEAFRVMLPAEVLVALAILCRPHQPRTGGARWGFSRLTPLWNRTTAGLSPAGSKS